MTRSRNAVSTREHLEIAWHRKIDRPVKDWMGSASKEQRATPVKHLVVEGWGWKIPNGRSMAARAQSTKAWWKIKPWLHLSMKQDLYWPQGIKISASAIFSWMANILRGYCFIKCIKFLYSLTFWSGLWWPPHGFIIRRKWKITIPREN